MNFAEAYSLGSAGALGAAVYLNSWVFCLLGTLLVVHSLGSLLSSEVVPEVKL